MKALSQRIWPREVSRLFPARHLRAEISSDLPSGLHRDALAHEVPPLHSRCHGQPSVDALGKRGAGTSCTAQVPSLLNSLFCPRGHLEV